jgi:hypothetical protein
MMMMLSPPLLHTVYPRDKLSLQDVLDILPVIHKVAVVYPAWDSATSISCFSRSNNSVLTVQYDIQPLLLQVSDQLANVAPSSWSMERSHPYYLVK